MFPKYRHSPILDTSRKRCAVCNHAVYSLAGIHPQCAVRLTDPPQMGKKKSGLAGAESQGDSPGDQLGLA